MNVCRINNLFCIFKSNTYYKLLDQYKPSNAPLFEFKRYYSAQEKPKINKQFFSDGDEINKIFKDLQNQYKNLKIKFNIICPTKEAAKETTNEVVKIIENSLNSNDIKLIITLLKILSVLIVCLCLFVIGCVILINDTRI